MLAEEFQIPDFFARPPGVFAEVRVSLPEVSRYRAFHFIARGVVGVVDDRFCHGSEDTLDDI